MGNSCECVRRQSSGDEAEDALLASLVAEGTTDGRPRGPPPPYQVRLFELCYITVCLALRVDEWSLYVLRL